MGFSIEIQIEAIWEIQDAFNWYEEQREGLGHEFLAEIETCYQKLSKDPEHYSYINEIFRRIRTNRFLYLLIYEIDDSRVIINSVRHAKRKPKG